MLRMRDIMAGVAGNYGLTVDDLRGPSRRRPIALARHEAMYLCRREGRWSLKQIAHRFGRTHCAVIHGVSVHEARVQG